MTQDLSPNSVKRRDSVGPTDMAPVSKRPYEKHLVKVTLVDPHAFIVSKNEKISERWPINMVQKRFKDNEKIAYFWLVIKSGTDVHELSDRAPTPEVGW